jgi:FAD-linked oxidoreductase
MKNWSGLENWNPAEILFPESEEAIQQIVKSALDKKQKIRIIGSGHSFTKLCVTNDILITLDKYQGLVQVDKSSNQVTIKGGTKLKKLGELLHAEGLAMENLGDIDAQSIAGTISTGTHGTGAGFGTISTQVRAIRLVNGLGEIVECSTEKNVELFKAAQVSLGALGVITQITLQCLPSYKLKMVYEKSSLSEVLKTYKSINQATRNFELYWMPFTDAVLTKKANVTNEEVDKIGVSSFFQEYILENLGFKILCEVANLFPSKNRWVSEISAKTLSTVVKKAYSHNIYATVRAVRFNEMEYNVPIEAYEEVMKEIQRSFEKNEFQVHFPIENRFVKGDDIYLSPAFGRDSAYIACHVYSKKKHEAYFQKMEDIFKAHDGRPHWGKLHTRNANELLALYPKMSDFLKNRAEQDPEQIFISPYLKTLLNIL